MISLGGDCSGGVSFNGAGNVTLNATVKDDSHNHVISNIDGLQTALNTKLSTGGKAADSNLLDGYDHTAFIRSFQVEDGDGTEVTINQGKEWKFTEGAGININWTDTSPGSDADPFDLNFSVLSAPRWTNARTISFAGDVRGSISIDGSASKTVNLTVLDNSHYHSASNITSGILSASRLPVATTSTRGAVKLPEMRKSNFGYWKCNETGLVIQWSKYTSTVDTVQSFIFPISFSSTCLTVQTGGEIQHFGSSLNYSRTGFSIDRYDGVSGSHAFSIIAIGY